MDYRILNIDYGINRAQIGSIPKSIIHNLTSNGGEV